MKKGYLVVGLALAAILAALLQRVPDASAPPAPPVVSAEQPQPVVASVPSAMAAAPPPEDSTPVLPSATPLPRAAGSPLAAELNAPHADAQRDVETLHTLLRQYFMFLKRRPGRPIGNDSDLARVFTGQNPMRLVILPKNHPALSADGRLRDRFGTPYFLHPRGDRAYEIRSAGPDRKLFTADDAIANPAPGHTDLSSVPPDPEFAEP